MKTENIPESFTKTIGATMAPKGYEFWNNRKSRFSGKREIALVKINQQGGLK